jgi:hypothetical protein
MKRFNVTLAIALITVCGILVSGAAYAKDKVSVYKVTVTNITRGQIISPPIVISHNRHFELFSLGDPATPATPGLAALAEDADTTVLKHELDASSSVYDYNEAAGIIMPGSSATVEIKTKRGFQRISAAGMLVTTNDAFFAVRGVYARYWGNTATYARAYDAGSEVNSELCEFIPGPPCGSPGERDTVGAEGYVYIHSGIHGIGNLDPAESDWNNPVATVRVQRVK